MKQGDIEMLWKNYADDIAKLQGVILSGWPASSLNIDNASHTVLEAIKTGLDDETIQWKEAAENEIEEHLAGLKTAPKQARKMRSDRGVKRRQREQDNEDSTEQISPSVVHSDADD